MYESRVGDVITLGTSTWQIQEITRDRVVVVPAPGRTARLPFWHGEGDGRDAAFGRSQGRFIRDMAQGLRAEVSDGIAGDKTSRFDTTTIARLRRDGLDDNAIGNLADCLPNSAPPRERFPTTVSWSSNAARMKKAIGV